MAEILDTKKLKEQLLDPNTDKSKVVDILVASLDQMVIAFNEAITAATEANKLSEETLEINRAHSQTIMDFTQALKNIHIILGRNSPEEINMLKTDLAKWILAPATIKMGVLKDEITE